MDKTYHQFSVAPMLDWTDRHCRYFYRLMTKRALLYTEMVTTGAILHGDRDRHLSFNREEHPVSLQLGGSDPAALSECAKIAEDYGYTEINLNCGCPSDRVQKGKFGAVLMHEPNLVAECISEMSNSVTIPITIKNRIGVDQEDSFEFLDNFININQNAGCDTFIIHARKAWLSGLSPKENRDIPPLDYDRVYQIKKNYPKLTIVLNGGISSILHGKDVKHTLDGVMLGRSIYYDPAQLLCVDSEIFGEGFDSLDRISVVKAMKPYIENHIAKGGKLNHVTRHMLNIFNGLPRSKQWRRILSENMHKNDMDFTLIEYALQQCFEI